MGGGVLTVAPLQMSNVWTRPRSKLEQEETEKFQVGVTLVPIAVHPWAHLHIRRRLASLYSRKASDVPFRVDGPRQAHAVNPHGFECRENPSPRGFGNRLHVPQDQRLRFGSLQLAARVAREVCLNG